MRISLTAGPFAYSAGTRVLDLEGYRREVQAAERSGFFGVYTGERRGIAVALNGEVVPRSAWDVTDLRPGDRVEVLTAAQGG